MSPLPSPSSALATAARTAAPSAALPSRRASSSSSSSSAAAAAAATARLLPVPLPSRRRQSRRSNHHQPPRAAKADADEDIIPLFRPPPTSFTDAQLEQLKHPHLLKPGSTMREELEALRDAYVGAEAKALKGEEKLFSKNWDGDVYVGSQWNVATVLALVSAVTTLGGLAFAMATKGVLWATVDYYGM